MPPCVDVEYRITESELRPVARAPKRRRFQYSLRTLLLVVYVGGPCLGWVGIAAKGYVMDFFWPPSTVEVALRWLRKHQSRDGTWSIDFRKRASSGKESPMTASKEASMTAFAGGLPFLATNGARPPLLDKSQSPVIEERSAADGCPPRPINHPNEGAAAQTHRRCESALSGTGFSSAEH